MNRIYILLAFLITLSGCAGLSTGWVSQPSLIQDQSLRIDSEFSTKVVMLQREPSYPTISLDQVFDGYSPSVTEWVNPILKNDAGNASKIHNNKIAIVEVSYDDAIGGFGSAAPFILNARREAAGLGGNLLTYESGVETKNTGRYVSMTFAINRVTFNNNPLHMEALNSTEATPPGESGDVNEKQ